MQRKCLPITKANILFLFAKHVPNKNCAKKEIALISGLAAMIHSLELEIIGEGVENMEHLELCRQLKIHNVQGYFFDKPLPLTDLEQRYCQLPANHYN